MSLYGAILLDTRSIQKYVFSCSKLKTNIGASFIVDSIFNDGIEAVLKAMGYKLPSRSKDDIKTKDILMESDASIDAEIAYEGGGKALILLRPTNDWEARAKEIIYNWSKLLLVKAPGLKTGAAIGEIDISEENFANSYRDLLIKLKQYQNYILPQVDYPSSGLTLDCDISGKVADVLDEKNNRYISKEVKAKIDAYDIAYTRIREQYKDILEDKYDFASDLEDLGYEPGESYISIIHVDGNNMGSKFAQCKTLAEYKELSSKVASIINDGFRKLLSRLVADIEAKRYEQCLKIKKHKGITILPIRPIIIGGDDVTFICPGRLGLTMAREFIENIGSYELLSGNLADKLAGDFGKKMTCCAGVAIVPAKYPFFRAYNLTEQLCSVAKKASRKHDSSWLDFAILHGEVYPTVDQLRDNQYIGVEGKLHLGPYKVDKDVNNIRSVAALWDLQAKISNEVANNKAKKLREVLTQDKHRQYCYWDLADDMKKIMKALYPNKDKLSADNFWEYIKDENGKNGAKYTRFIDAIEIMDFMPNNEEGAGR